MIEYVDKSFNDGFDGAKVLVFATNGSIKKNRENVMGKGLGKMIAALVPSMPKALGALLVEKGLQCFAFKMMSFIFISFPTKENYYDEESIELIRKSAEQLKDILIEYKINNEKILMEYPLLSKEMKEEVRDALKDLDVIVYMK